MTFYVFWDVAHVFSNTDDDDDDDDDDVPASISKLNNLAERMALIRDSFPTKNGRT